MLYLASKFVLEEEPSYTPTLKSNSIPDPRANPHPPLNPGSLCPINLQQRMGTFSGFGINLSKIGRQTFCTAYMHAHFKFARVGINSKLTFLFQQRLRHTCKFPHHILHLIYKHIIHQTYFIVIQKQLYRVTEKERFLTERYL